MRDRIPNTVRCERGVALPLALLGLVSVSLLVTTALVTSSTELAISGAHQDATSALYGAEGGLQAYVAQNGTTLQNAAGTGDFEYTPPAGGSEVVLTVTHLGSQQLVDQSTMRLYSINARLAQGGGRTVSAMATQIVPPPNPLNLAVTSAMTVGGDLSVNGNAFNVNGQSTACGSQGVEALRLASDSELTLGNAQQTSNRVNRFRGTNNAGVNTTGFPVIERAGTRAELANNVLGGRTIDEIAADVPTSNWRYRVRTPTYTGSWLLSTLAPADEDEDEGGTGVAVVDAEGGTIAVGAGDYEGILIVINGSVSLSGEVNFDGIIIAERNFSLSGGVAINGAIISLAMDGENVVDNNGDNNTMGGSISVNYNLCDVQAALQAYGNVVPNTQTPVVQPTVSWLEVVR